MKYPIYFLDYHICIRCGSHHVVAVDKFGRETKTLIYPITNMVCKNCGSKFIIKWIRKDGDMIPVCTNNEELRNIEKNIIKNSIENQRKI